MATKKSAVKDLTNGSPVKLILGFALPLLLGMLFQQFYSMVDTIIVGKFLGAKALAAVGSTGSINFMIVGFCMGVCNGTVAHSDEVCCQCILPVDFVQFDTDTRHICFLSLLSSDLKRFFRPVKLLPV